MSKQGERGHWAVFYTSPQSFKITFFLLVGLTTLVIYCMLIGWLSVKTFQPLIVIFIMGNFVYRHWGCTSMYRLLSYRLRSLITKN